MEGFPSDVEEKEAYFMNEVAQGEGLCQEGSFRCEFFFGGGDKVSRMMGKEGGGRMLE